MIDKLLAFGRVFDWITPTIAILQDLFYGSPRDFGISAESQWGISEVRGLLDFYGIISWGFMYALSGDMLRFSVNKSQSDVTYFILQQAGVPILYAPRIRAVYSMTPYR